MNVIIFVATLLLSPLSLAQSSSLSEEVEKMKGQISELERKINQEEVQRLDLEIEEYRKQIEKLKADSHTEKNSETEALESKITSLKSKKFTILNTNISNQDQPHQGLKEMIALQGLIEVDIIQQRNFSESTNSRVELSTLELAAEASINHYVKGNILIEKQDRPSSSFDATEAFLTFGNTADHLFNFRLGRMVIPFGQFETSLNSDPLSLELAENHSEVVMGEFEWMGIITSAYLFNGETKEVGQSNRLRHYGLQMGYIFEMDDWALESNINYISNMAESDSLRSTVSSSDLQRSVPASAYNMALRYHQFTFILEYLTAHKEFASGDLSWKGRGAKPSAAQVELSYSLNMKHLTTFILGHQNTREALALGLPKEKYLLGLISLINAHSSVSFEQSFEKDYLSSECSQGQCGSGKDGYTSTLRFALTF